MKKIAFLIGTLNPYGAQRVILNIIKFLDKDKFQPFLIYWRDGGLSKKFQQIEELKIIKLKTQPKHNPKALYCQYREIKQIIKDNEIDILHTHLYVPDLYGSLIKLTNRRLRFISTKHDINPIPLWIRIPRYLFFNPDSFIAISENVKANTPARIIYNGIEIKRPIKNVKKFETLTVISVGRLIEEKGHRTLIRAVKIINKEFSNFQVLIAGGGSEHFPSPDNVHFIGERKNIRSLLMKSHIFVLMTRREGLGIALIEASSCRLPIVSSNIDGVKEVVKNGKSGILVNPTDSFSVSRAILKLLKDAQLRKRMGEEGYSIVKKKFNVLKMVKEYEKEYESI